MQNTRSFEAAVTRSSRSGDLKHHIASCKAGSRLNKLSRVTPLVSQSVREMAGWLNKYVFLLDLWQLILTPSPGLPLHYITHLVAHSPQPCLANRSVIANGIDFILTSSGHCDIHNTFATRINTRKLHCRRPAHHPRATLSIASCTRFDCTTHSSITCPCSSSAASTATRTAASVRTA